MKSSAVTDITSASKQKSRFTCQEKTSIIYTNNNNIDLVSLGRGQYLILNRVLSRSLFFFFVQKSTHFGSHSGHIMTDIKPQSDPNRTNINTDEIYKDTILPIRGSNLTTYDQYETKTKPILTNMKPQSDQD